ncbi:MAG: hypothetical protein GF334_05670 [Candidatus Altiarchaeales archaeon]|nr:hypothetical protein [Candidatus Altiarchaeales archaeon]
MKKVFYLLILSLLLGCLNEESGLQQPQGEKYVATPLTIKSFTTNKELYRSRERMNMSVNIHSPLNSSCEVWVHGIKPYRKSNLERLYLKKDVDLNAGLNEVVFEYKLPSCTSCSGIREGSYEVVCEVSCGNQTLIQNKSIEVRK